MAEVYTTKEPRDTVVVDGDRVDHTERHGLSTGAIVAIVVVALLLLFLLIGNPFAGGGGGTTNTVNVPAPTAGQ